MSKKKILTEAEIRRFQGLAGLPVVNEFQTPAEEVEEGMHDGARHEDEEDLEEMDHLAARHDDEPELPGDEGPEDAGLEMDVEMEPSDEGGDLDLSPDQKEDLAADIVRAVAQELSQALDLDEPIEVETDGGDDLEMDLAMGDDDAMDLELGDEPAGDLEEPAPPAGDDDPEGMRYMEEEEELEEAHCGDREEEKELEESNNEDLVNEVLRRVVARLSKKE